MEGIVELTQDFYSTGEVAQMTGRQMRHVSKLCSDGKIKATRTSGMSNWRIPRAEVERMLLNVTRGEPVTVRAGIDPDDVHEIEVDAETSKLLLGDGQPSNVSRNVSSDTNNAPRLSQSPQEPNVNDNQPEPRTTEDTNRPNRSKRPLTFTFLDR